MREPRQRQRELFDGPVQPVPRGLHKRVTMRVHIASYQDRLAAQRRRAAMVLALSLVLLAAASGFVLHQTGVTDVDRYTPSGILGQIDYYLANISTMGSLYQGSPVLITFALLVASMGIVALLWWLGKQGEPSVPRDDRLLRRKP